VTCAVALAACVATAFCVAIVWTGAATLLFALVVAVALALLGIDVVVIYHGENANSAQNDHQR